MYQVVFSPEKLLNSFSNLEDYSRFRRNFSLTQEEQTFFQEKKELIQMLGSKLLTEEELLALDFTLDQFESFIDDVDFITGKKSKVERVVNDIVLNINNIPAQNCPYVLM